METAIFISVLLLVGLTWLLYKLTVLLEPGGDKAASGAALDSAIAAGSGSRQKPINQRLRK